MDINMEDLKAQSAVLEALSTYIAVSKTEVPGIRMAADSLADNLAKFVLATAEENKKNNA